jgi:hypothetical protein
MSKNLAKDCRLAAEVLKDTGMFETGQSILTEAAEHIADLTAERDAALARASEAENKASSAQHSVEVLEKRAAGFLARAERAEAALREIAAIPRSDAAYGIIQVMARHALK